MKKGVIGRAHKKKDFRYLGTSVSVHTVPTKLTASGGIDFWPRFCYKKKSQLSLGFFVTTLCSHLG
jgi:hypothetical protein